MLTPSLASSSLLLWIAWVVLNTAAVVSAYVLSTALFESDRTITAAILLLTGLLLALAQWLLVRIRIPRPGLWIPATFVAWVTPLAGTAILFPLTEQSQQPQVRAALVSVGLLMGAMQFLLLRPLGPRWQWWVPASILGWAMLALWLPIPITNQVEIIKVGVVPASITGIPFALLFRADKVAGKGRPEVPRRLTTR